ncbi:MAG: hypothetical protein IH914_08465, partial [candidate division Zixibacteria bacterium]|nr:hypothetical protein [candidate division Zixibacteria bacterium]
MHLTETSPSGCTGQGRDKTISSLLKILTSLFILGFMALGASRTAEAVSFTVVSSCDTVNTISGFELMFDSVTYDLGLGTSKWNYTLIWDGTPPALSHFIIELCSTVTNANLVAVSPANGSIVQDGSTGLYGIKWNDIQNFPANTPVSYSFTLDSLYAIESGEFAPKAGVNSNIAEICGPSIDCLQISPCLPPKVQTDSGLVLVGLCQADSIFIGQVQAGGDGTGEEPGDTITLELLFGSVVFTTVVAPRVERDLIFTPDTAGLYTIIFKVTDLCGLMDTDTLTIAFNAPGPADITINANTPPIAKCPAGPIDIFVCDLSQICLPGFSCSDVDGNLDASLTTVTVNGSPVPLLGDTVCFTPIEGANTITLICVDSCGAADTCVTTIFVQLDTTPPTITCPSDITVQCIGDVPAPDTNLVVVSDNCPNPVSRMFVSDSSDNLTCPETIIRTYKATDANGNMAFCTQIITVNDTIPPVISCPADITIECGSGSATGSATATDNCDSAPSVSSMDSVVLGACLGDTTIFRRWIATDDCDNADSCVQIITIKDTTPPTITCPVNLTIECGASSAPSATGSATATDVCDPNPTITFTDVVSGNSCTGDSLITRTFKATDCSGNADSCVQLISVKDTTPPVITCPPPATVECGDPSDPSVTGTATAKDTCDANPAITFTDVVTGNSCTGDSLITRTFKATDCSGNADSCVQLISVKDTTPPPISCPANITIECGSGAATGSATATDICDPNPIISFTDVVTPGACPADTTITRTFKATDCSGNADSCVQIITIQDLTPPTITCPVNLTIECGASSAPSATGSATATDVCDPNPTITFT